ncbi:ATP-binding protein [Actinokineospora spheciospongiae]|uniref:ATP-binding protein n=1 Tax=Actinokineospora spheciospongiae TaxID=909613 RepID=UPI0004BC7F75|nr:tetratricopeptide repeat protein [Actinokineospora spheciospongiae]
MVPASSDDVWRAARQGFGRVLRSLRVEANLKQGSVSAAISASDSALSDLERGVGARPPRRDVVRHYVDHCLGAIAADEAVLRERRRAVWAAFAQLEALHEQLGDIAGPEHAPPGGAPSTLRRDVHAFTGRVDELALLVETAEQVDTASHRVIAVHAVDGMPGVGKTAFAVHAAHLLADRFPDGQVFLDLHGHSPGRAPVDPRDALASLLAALGVNPLDLPEGVEARAELWRKVLSGKRVLLVLDNVADHAQVEALLPGEGRCLVLVTSRRRLVELDVVSIDLAPLSADEAERMFQDLAARPVSEPRALGELVRLCGRLPLALAILAARFRNRKALSVARLVEELTDAGNRLPALRSGDRAVAAAFDLSYRDLPPRRQRFFRLLGLHPGEGIERFAAAAVCGIDPDEAEAHLDALHHEHLVDEILLGRFRMHDLIAEYARALVGLDDPDPTAAALASLLDFYEQAAGIAGDLLARGSRDDETDTGAASRLPRFADAAQAMDWTDEERANLLICLDWAEEPERVVGFALALAPYLRRTGPWDLVLRVHHRAVGAARALGVPEVEGRTLLELGKTEFYADNYERAQVVLRGAVKIFTELGDHSRVARALMSLGQTWMQTGDYSDAEEAYSQALAAHEQAGDVRGVAAVLVELGTLHYYQDEYAEAVDTNNRALRIYEELGDHPGQATALKGLTHAFLFSDDYERAHDAATKAQLLFRDLRMRLGEAQVLSLLGSIDVARGRFAEARDSLEAAVRAYDGLGDRAGVAMAMIELGIALRHLGEFPRAEETLRAALALYEELGEPAGKAAVRRELAELLTASGKLPGALALLDEAEALYQKLDDRYGKAATSSAYGAWHLASGDPGAARSRYAEALRLARDIAGPAEEASALAGMARVARALGEHEAADRAFREAVAIHRRIGSGKAAGLAAEAGLE